MKTFLAAVGLLLLASVVLAQSALDSQTALSLDSRSITIVNGKLDDVKKLGLQPPSLDLTQKPSYLTGDLSLDLTKRIDQFARWPVDSRRITSGYGPRIKPCAKCSSFHQGIDIGTGGTVPVYAVAAGFVKRAESRGNCGLNIEIFHGTTSSGQKISSGYCHLHQAIAKSGFVHAGQLIAISGGGREDPEESRGSSTAHHLHFYVKLNDKLVPPRGFLLG